MQIEKNWKVPLVVLAAGIIYVNFFTYVDSTNSVFAQLNAPKGSAMTMIGNVTIPRMIPHVKYNNVSSNVAFNKENTTAPISPTGISTQSNHLPPAIENTTNNATIPNTVGTNATSTALRMPSIQK